MMISIWLLVLTELGDRVTIFLAAGVLTDSGLSSAAASFLLLSSVVKATEIESHSRLSDILLVTTRSNTSLSPGIICSLFLSTRFQDSNLNISSEDMTKLCVDS